MEEITGVESDAEEVGGDETELGSANADDADDGTVDRGDDPTLPELAAKKDGAENGQNAGDVIQANSVECVDHGRVRGPAPGPRRRSLGSRGHLVKLCSVDEGSFPERVSWRRAVCGAYLLRASLVFPQRDRQFRSHSRREWGKWELS